MSAMAEAKAAVERRCANRIEALIGGRQWHAADRPGDPRFSYGAADIPDDAATPWGTSARWDPPWNRGLLGVVVRYQLGVTVDGVGGMIDGIGVLSGVYGSYAWLASKVGLVDPSTVTAQQAATSHAWRGLALAALAVNPVTRPIAHRLTPDLADEADATVREMAKGMVAFDTWRTDPARAAGAATFNLGTMLLPGGEASGAVTIVKGLRTGGEASILGRLLSRAEAPRLLDTVPDLHRGPDSVCHAQTADTAARMPDIDDLATADPDVRDVADRGNEVHPAQLPDREVDARLHSSRPTEHPPGPTDLHDRHELAGTKPVELAREVPNGSEKALHAGSIDKTTAKVIVRHYYPHVEDVNAWRWTTQRSGYTTNCTRCVVATDSTLAGEPAGAPPLPPGHSGAPADEVAQYFGRPWRSVSSYDEIVRALTKHGPGSRGIVWGKRGLNRPGHVFNVVHDRNGIVFIDGQTGSLARLGGFTDLSLLLTT